MANLVEDWEFLKATQADKQGYYQVLSNDGSVEVRVAIGRPGFRKEFDKKACMSYESAPLIIQDIVVSAGNRDFRLNIGLTLLLVRVRGR